MSIKRHYYLKSGGAGFLDIEYIGDSVDVGIKGKKNRDSAAYIIDNLPIVSNIEELWFFQIAVSQESHNSFL